jgi:hypothetical protein
VDRPASRRSVSPASSEKTLSAGSSVSAEVEKPDPSPAEPKIDPALEKYMAMVKQQREQEQQVCHPDKTQSFTACHCVM